LTHVRFNAKTKNLFFLNEELFSNVHSYELSSKYRLLTSITACHLSSRNSLEWNLQCQLYCSYRQKVCRRQKFNWAHKTQKQLHPYSICYS